VLRKATCIVVAASVVASWATPAGTCSCVGDRTPRFLVPSGVTFPADFRGIPCTNLKDVSPKNIQIVLIEPFRHDQGARTPPLETVIETPPFPDEYARTYNPWQRGKTGRGDNGSLFLICAKWQSGATYRIWLKDSRQEIIIHVSTQPFESAPHKIDIWQSEQTRVLTSTAHGSCSTVFDGFRVGVEMTGETTRLWREALLYLTVVDDTLTWRPEFDICEEVPAGRSWVGTARELLYGHCGSEQDALIDGPLWNLTQGYHDVKMIAWLPGVSQVSGKGTVFIGCR